MFAIDVALTRGCILVHHVHIRACTYTCSTTWSYLPNSPTHAIDSEQLPHPFASSICGHELCALEDLALASTSCVAGKHKLATVATVETREDRLHWVVMNQDRDRETERETHTKRRTETERRSSESERKTETQEDTQRRSESRQGGERREGTRGEDGGKRERGDGREEGEGGEGSPLACTNSSGHVDSWSLQDSASCLHHSMTAATKRKPLSLSSSSLKERASCLQALNAAVEGGDVGHVEAFLRCANSCEIDPKTLMRLVATAAGDTWPSVASEP